ncbi:MAG: NAD(+) synthase [Clostridia bacterium]|nr:NAD(+) synthase [Clostridia bacterium]
MFDAKTVKDELIDWTRDWFDSNGKDCNAIIGISGGKDSSVCAALCVEALGKERVVGVLMPNLKQDDINDSYQLVEFLGIKNITVPISVAVAAIDSQLRHCGIDISRQTTINLPPRIRMSVLYAVSQSMNGRVINTCNLSEDYVGYSTRYGDSAGDVSLLGGLTVQEVKAIGLELGLPKNLVYKTPSDGLCQKTDEDNLGFTYETLDTYIRDGICENVEIKNKIDVLHNKNKFKLELMPVFTPSSRKMKEGNI